MNRLPRPEKITLSCGVVVSLTGLARPHAVLLDINDTAGKFLEPVAAREIANALITAANRVENAERERERRWESTMPVIPQPAPQRSTRRMLEGA